MTVSQNSGPVEYIYNPWFKMLVNSFAAKEIE